MRKSLKNKILISVPAIFIAVMFVVIVVVSVILSKQNRQAANTLLGNAFNIARYTLSEKQEKLLFDSRQMSSLEDMGGNIKYATESKPYFTYDVMRPTYINIASVMYGTSTAGNIWKASIYNLSGDLIAFTTIGENESILGCIHNRQTIEIAHLKPNEDLTRESWAKQDNLPVGTEYSFGRAILDRETAHFEIIDDSLCLVAYVPVMGKVYNSATEKMEPKQVGMVVTAQKLDPDFVRKMSELTGTKTNIFACGAMVCNGPCCGTYADYKTFDLSGFADASIGWNLSGQPVTFSDVDIAGCSYFQGVLPIYSGSKCVAAIVSLYSKETAKANTMQIIKLLSLVYVVGILSIVPITILVVVRGIINPIKKIAFLMRETARKKDFTEMLNVESQDEIGDLASSFNEMTENLRKTTTSIDNLNREITERKKAQEELTQLLSLHGATLEATADGILVVDLDGRVVSHNLKFLQLWRIPDSIAKTKDDEKLLTHVLDQLTDPEGFLAEVRRLYSHIEEQSRDFLEFKDGRVFERFSQPQRISSRIVGRVWSFRDVTDRKKADERQTQLLEQVERTNRELTEFAYIVSHDLKAPLRGVKVLVDWMSNDYADKLDEQGKEQMKLLLTRVDRMHNLIDGILQYSRVGRVKEQKVQVNLNGLVPEIIDMLTPPESISITVENDLPMIECEKARITQVFQNLISNAIKYMDKPEGRVHIACVDEGDFWKFSVADNGPGIEERYFDKIFQLFQTLARRDDYESTGIGLTVVKKIVEMYGGRIWVESKVGEGSTFSFTFPKQQERVKDEKLQASVVESDGMDAAKVH